MLEALIFILKILSKLTLWRYQPKIIGITGSVGKTSSKEAIYHVLSQKFNVRRNQKNYNNEIGVPLTILGLETGGRSFFNWLRVFSIGFARIIYSRNFPEILVLEMGADKIGDIEYLTSFVKCHVGVITAIGEIPVHVEFFQGSDQVALEKSILIKKLAPDGWAVLNFDDVRVKAMAQRTKANVLGYGFSSEAKLKASNLEQHLEDLGHSALTFKVDYKGSNVPLRLSGFLGGHQVCPVLAAIATGLVFKMNLVEISQGLKNYVPPKGRLNILRGIKNSWVIDDTYNASPNSTAAALDVLSKIKGRRIAVLGDMLELGFFTEKAHREVGAQAAKCADILFTVGERSLFMDDEARKKGMPKENLAHFDSSDEAALPLQTILREGDTVLIKGSQGTRMEKITREIMAEPEKAEELLVRQDKNWMGK